MKELVCATVSDLVAPSLTDSDLGLQKDNQYDNIVIVLALKYNIPLQDAIDRACSMVVDARGRLEEAEARLPLPTGDSDLDAQVKQYIQGCRDVTAGNLHWRYAS